MSYYKIYNLESNIHSSDIVNFVHTIQGRSHLLLKSHRVLQAFLLKPSSTTPDFTIQGLDEQLSSRIRFGSTGLEQKSLPNPVAQLVISMNLNVM